MSPSVPKTQEPRPPSLPVPRWHSPLQGTPTLPTPPLLSKHFQHPWDLQAVRELPALGFLGLFLYQSKFCSYSYFYKVLFEQTPRKSLLYAINSIPTKYLRIFKDYPQHEIFQTAPGQAAGCGEAQRGRLRAPQTLTGDGTVGTKHFKMCS